ncbi:hypothetical protein BJ944DRAFT_228097 [Cunninghamella echinulata]|nr:hypothetical protein BJ944DRAFT_228097 [Cunninghamella echinulata]
MSKFDNDILWKFEAPTFYDFTKTEEENNHIGDSWFDQSNKPLHSTLLEFNSDQQQKDGGQDLKINYEEQSSGTKIDDPFLNYWQQQQQQKPFNYTNDVYIHSPTHRIAPTKQRRDMKFEILRYNENTNSPSHENNIDSPQKTRKDNNDINLGSEYSPTSNDVILEPSATMIKPSIDLMAALLHNKHHDEEINKKRRKEMQMETEHTNKEINNDLDLNEKDGHDNKKRKLISTSQNTIEKKEKEEVKEKEKEGQHSQPIEKTLAQVLASVATYSAIIKKNHTSSFSHQPLSPLRIKSTKSSSTSSSTTMFTSPQRPQSLPLLPPTYRMESVLQRAKRVLQESHIKSKLWSTSDLSYDNSNHFDLKQSLSSLRIMKQPKVINQRQSILLNRKTSYVTTSTTKSVPEIDYLESKEEKNNDDNGDSGVDVLLQYNLLEDDNDPEENDIQPSFFSYWNTPYLPVNLTRPRSPKFQTDKRSRYYR